MVANEDVQHKYLKSFISSKTFKWIHKVCICLFVCMDQHYKHQCIYS